MCERESVCVSLFFVCSFCYYIHLPIKVDGFASTLDKFVITSATDLKHSRNNDWKRSLKALELAFAKALSSCWTHAQSSFWRQKVGELIMVLAWQWLFHIMKPHSICTPTPGRYSTGWVDKKGSPCGQGEWGQWVTQETQSDPRKGSGLGNPEQEGGCAGALIEIGLAHVYTCTSKAQLKS